MKKSTFLATILFASFSFAQVPNYVPTAGLLSWWPFNGNANDESGNNNNGTVNGAALTTDLNGVNNKAYSFNGSSDFIQTNLVGPIGNSSRSVSYWMNSSSNQQYMTVLGYGDNVTASKDFHIWHNWGCDGVGINIINTATTYTYGSLNNNWKHFVFVFDNSISTSIANVKVYMNGVLLNNTCATVGSGNINTSGNVPITIGKLGVNSYYFNGKLDDIGIWSRALTQQEITDLYNGAFNLPVELTQFSASCSENTTTINWQTASENNSAYFEVLQSRDGEVWTSKTTTPAAGNSTSTIDYSFTDNNEASLVYYKLKQVDKDGQYKEYGPISANCNENNQLTIYPNPTTGEITLRGLEQFSNVSSLSINDINGTVVKELDPTTTLFYVETLQAGVYFLTITAENKQEVVKIIKE